MGEIAKSARGIVTLLEQGTLSLAVWNVYLEGIADHSFRELALRIRSSLEYGTATKQLKGVVKANYLGALASWKLEKKDDAVTKAGNELITAAEKYIKSRSIALV